MSMVITEIKTLLSLLLMRKTSVIVTTTTATRLPLLHMVKNIISSYYIYISDMPINYYMN